MAKKIKLPTRKIDDKTMLSVEIDSALLKKVKNKTKKLGVTLRDTVEYGFKVFLQESKEIRK